MQFALAMFVVASMLTPPAAGCPAMHRPVDGPVSAAFAPVGLYSGHWGVDFAVPPGSDVVAADRGTVSFAGVVAGNRSVTVDHGGGVKSSYSYLAGVRVEVGDAVRRGDVIAASGSAHGAHALHFSVRIAGDYVDPLRVLSCSILDLSVALRLVPASQMRRPTAYPSGREKGHPRRNIRPTARCAFARR